MRFFVVLLSLCCLVANPAWAEKEGCRCSPCVCTDHQTDASLEGRLSAAGPSIYMEGSHELRDASGKVIARLSGLKADLDLQSYEGEWVKVTGAWRPTVEAGGKIFEAASIQESKGQKL